jgi:hypothetical protein
MKITRQDKIDVLQETIEWFEGQIKPQDCGWMKSTISGIKHRIEDLKKNKYQVGVTIHNSFVVDALNEEEAELKVRELDVHDTLKDCDFNIGYVDCMNAKKRELHE